MNTALPVAKGGAVISFIVGITAFITGPLGLLILDAITCDFNIVFSSGCGDVDTGGGGDGGASSGQACTSAPNSCGMTTTGFIVDAVLDGCNPSRQNCDYLVCNADVPPDSQCIAPTVTQNSFYADPATIGVNLSTTLHWDISDAIAATECTISGSNGFSHSGTGSGSVSSGPLEQTTSFTLSCQNGTGPAASATIRVNVDPRYQEI